MKGATSLLIVTLFLSNLLGFLRDRFLAQKLPAGQVDIYFNAFSLPDFVFNVLILGAVTTAFIPVFTDYLFKKNKDEDAWRLANTIINLAIILLVGSLVILYVLMPWLIPIISPFKEPERVQATIQLGRILLIQPFFFGLSYIAGSILNSFKRFVAYSIAPLIYNISIIVGIVYLSPRYGIAGVVYGVLGGALLHFLIQVPTLFSLNFRYRPILDLKQPGVKQIARLMIPRTIQLVMVQLIAIAFTRAAAELPIGSASGINYADNIQTVPTVVFGNAFAVASFPYLSEAFSSQNVKNFNHYLIRSTKAALFFLLPSAIGLYLLRVQIIRLILGSGHFGWDQTIMTSQALGMYAIGLVALGLQPLYSRAFFAMQDTKVPMLINIPITVINIILGYWLAFNLHMGIGGLALAYSIASILQLIILYWLLRPKILPEYERDLFMAFSLYLLMALVMAASIQLAKNFIGTHTDLHYTVNVLYQAGLGIGVGLVVYLGIAWLLRIEEVKFLWQKKKIFTKS